MPTPLAAPSLKPDAQALASEQAREPDPDRQAADLNARQRINQTFTVRRRAGDETFSETTVSVPADRDFARKPSEAGGTVRDYIRGAADATLLTRREAFSEAALDFSLLDQDRDGALTRVEYEKAAILRRSQSAYAALISEERDAKQVDHDDRYAAFAAADQREAQRAELRDQYAAFGEALPPKPLDQRGYTLGILKIFDQMDADQDGVLVDAELTAYRRALLPTGE
ncbi:MAG: hypothetical protein AAFY04_07155 [Pseudomonadota bacterium]